MNRLATIPSTAAVLFGLVLGLFAAPRASAQSLDAWVLTNNSLVMIDTANPAAAGAPVAITGLNAGDTLVGIDFRPVNGFLYGLGFNSGAGTVRLYNVSWRTGVATPIGATGTFVGADGTTPVPITATGFGLDFNPVTDRLRVVTDTNQNFRIDPNSGAFVDGDLGGAPASVAGVNMDGPITGIAAGAVGAAYSTNLPGVVVTTLYALNAASNQLYIQNPPDGGGVTTPITLTLNGNQLDFTSANGFDIPAIVFSFPDDASTIGNGYAALTVGGTTSLYRINLTNGVTTPSGIIGNGTMAIQGFAMLSVRVPEGCGAQGVAVLQTNRLMTFNTTGCFASGGGGPTPVTGLVAGETLVGIDFRPQTGQLYGLGFDAASGSGSATLYRLDPTTAAATIIGAPGGVADGSVTPIALTGAAVFGFDFDPTADRIRVVTDNGLNFRINPNDGTILGATLDLPINGLPDGSHGLVGAAYTNSYGQSLTGGGVTTLYTLDPGSDRLYIQDPAYAGTQTGGVPVTLNGQPVDFANVVALDIAPGIRVTSSGAPAAGVAHAVLGYGPSPNGGNAAIRVMINLATGVARRAGGAHLNEVWTAQAIGESPRNPTTIAVTSSSPVAPAGQPVTFTATISPPGVDGVSISPNNATGTVAFTIGGAPVSGCAARPITGMIATCTTSFATPGAVQIVAAFAGDTIHRGSTSTAVNQTTIAIVPSTMTLTATPSVATVGQSVGLVADVTPNSATGTVTFRMNGEIVATVGLSAGGALASTSVTLGEGTYQMQASYSGDSFTAPSQAGPVTVTVNPPSSGPLTQHFAEGATGFMQTDLGIFNAHQGDAAHVSVKLLPESGGPLVMPLTLGPLERKSLDLNVIARSIGLPDQGFSIHIESTKPVAATRQMTWGRPVYGSTLESGIPSTSKRWYFAEGATNIMSLYYLVENPNATPANIQLTHLLEGGGAPVTQTDVIPPFTRRTFDINAVPGLSSAALSTIVDSDVPVVAERAMYLNTSSRLWEGGAVGRGAPELSTGWSFAEGSTGFFHTYLCLGNPNNEGTLVSVVYRLTSGATRTKTYNVPGRSRLTIDVNNEAPELASADVGMTVSSTKAIVAERAMWWGDFPWIEGSVSIGTVEIGTTWAVAEGAEGGPSGESTFVQVANGSPSAGTLRFTVAYDDGTHEARDVTLLGNARTTVRIGADFPNSVGKKFSVLVESVTPGVAITVEYARYQSINGFGDGGGAALATRIY